MIRDQFLLDLSRELIIDNFAGGGGASTGIELALGRHVDIAINHDPEAVAMHALNHPQTAHHCESVWDIDPLAVTQGRAVGLAWFSPDCKHFSKAKGGKPRDKRIRGLAWVAVRWAALVRPRVVILENVEEFATWGPLLDDGFQHWRMRREFDIVLVDALDPFRGGVFPLGRLREPFSALRRADLIVITRARRGRKCPSLAAEIRRYNPEAPIAFARMRVRLPELPPGRVGAFCGLGQPEAFRVSLMEARAPLAFFEAFPDHHRYTPGEIRALAARADLLLTTEKDLLNLPETPARILAVPLELELEGWPEDFPWPPAAVC